MRRSDIKARSANHAVAVAVAAARRAFLLHCSAVGGRAAMAAVGGIGGIGGTGGTAAAYAQAPAVHTVLVVGDSLSAEYGLKRGSGWVALLQARLASEAPRNRVVNASISGDTTSGGRSRLPALLATHKPQLVVIELGGNDALRGLPLAATQDNLAQMARAARNSGARVVVVGMAVPPNYGRKYSDDFMTLFGVVAKAEGAGLVPFLLAGVADVPNAEALFQPDRIHPKAEAQPRMLANVWPVLRPLLK